MTKKIVNSITQTPNQMQTGKQKARGQSTSTDNRNALLTRPSGLTGVKSTAELLTKLKKPTKFKNSGSYAKFETYMSPNKIPQDASVSRSVTSLPTGLTKTKSITAVSHQKAVKEVYDGLLRG